jgi:two-component system phosphate regulon response regulator PhoB
MHQRVLVVEDDADIRALLAFTYRSEGFDVEAVETGNEALAIATRIIPDVVVLDLMLPDITGTEVCRQMRADANLKKIAILILTSRGDEFDRVLGFEVGADDYVLKPFSVRELLMRTRALLRRTARADDEGDTLRFHAFELDVARHHFLLAGQAIELRPLEFNLMALFLARPGHVFSREEIRERLWADTELQSRVIDTLVRRLRQKLGPFADAIVTVHGAGYRLG